MMGHQKASARRNWKNKTKRSISVYYIGTIWVVAVLQSTDGCDEVNLELQWVLNRRGYDRRVGKLSYCDIRAASMAKDTYSLGALPYKF